MSNYRDVTHFKNLFKAADADGNGLLEASELKDHLALESKIQENIKTMMKTGNMEECIEKVFIDFFMKSIDVSGSAMKTPIECLDHLKACVTADNHRWISDLFKLADTNNDGAVDLEEFRVAEEAREYKHKLFLELMGEAEKAHPEGLTEGQFCDLAGKKLTDKLVMEVQKKNKSL